MSLILGIDTGGTYTDGVLMDYNTKEVLAAAKAFTTKDDLAVGINNCIEQLKIEKYEDICLACMSTTLATNAVVEGKDMPVGLITIGETKKRNYPTLVSVNVKGKQDIVGREVAPMDESEIRQVLLDMKGEISALAISGYASVRNPQQEITVCSIASEILDVPVVCAYELTSALGFYERTVTAALNAKLIPIIEELMNDIKRVFSEKEIHAPLIIVKGDGHLMVESFAKEHPVETILSGPAASMVGGKFLTNVNDAIIVDMGGTTTDLVFITRGEASLEKEGASVGGWLTRVKAVEVKTFGLGGDSYIRVDPHDNLLYGPGRVIPLCVATSEYPYLYQELKEYRSGGKYEIINRQETDCFKLFKKKALDGHKLTGKQKRILKLLEYGPHSAFYLADKLDTDIDSLDVEKLMELELVQMISMTPTDLLHAAGEYVAWNRDAAVLGVSIYADTLGMDEQTFLNMAIEGFVYEICSVMLQSALEIDGLDLQKCGKEITKYLIKKLLDNDEDGCIDCQGIFNRPIIGIGAPANVWIRKAAKRVGADFILPEHDSVANAVGAAVSDIRESVEALIYYDPHISKYIAFLPQERKLFDALEIAKDRSRITITDCAKELAEKLSIESPEIIVSEEDEYIEGNRVNEKTFVKTHIKAVVSGSVTVCQKCSNKNDLVRNDTKNK